MSKTAKRPVFLRSQSPKVPQHGIGKTHLQFMWFYLKGKKAGITPSMAFASHSSFQIAIWQFSQKSSQPPIPFSTLDYWISNIGLHTDHHLVYEGLVRFFFILVTGDKGQVSRTTKPTPTLGVGYVMHYLHCTALSVRIHCFSNFLVLLKSLLVHRLD